MADFGPESTNTAPSLWKSGRQSRPNSKRARPRVGHTNFKLSQMSMRLGRRLRASHAPTFFGEQRATSERASARATRTSSAWRCNGPDWRCASSADNPHSMSASRVLLLGGQQRHADTSGKALRKRRPPRVGPVKICRSRPASSQIRSALAKLCPTRLMLAHKYGRVRPTRGRFRPNLASKLTNTWPSRPDLARISQT